MPDPLSLVSSIVTFIDAGTKIKGTLAKVGGNRGNLLHIKEDLVRGLTDIERFCRARYTRLNDSEAHDIKEALDELRSDLLDVHARVEKYLANRPMGILSIVSFNAKVWFNRASIEAEASRLESRIRSCYARFMSFAAARTEYNLVVQHQENLEHLEHLEDLVSYMLARNDSENENNTPSTDLPEPEEIDYQFLHRQVLKTVDALDKCTESWAHAPPRVIFGDELLPSWELNVSSEGFHFLGALRGSLITVQKLKGSINVLSITDCAASAIRLGLHLTMLGQNADMTLLFRRITTILYLFKTTATSYEYDRTVGLLQLFSAVTSPLSSASDAVQLWHEIYNHHPDTPNLLSLVQILQVYDLKLFQHEQFEKSLDCARQALLLFRMSPLELELGDTQLVTWSASGMADIVFSSSREISRPLDLLWTEAGCLWNVAKSLAFAGRYSEGLIAGTDAVSCLNACLAFTPAWYTAADEYLRWGREIPAWVSIVPNPSPELPSAPGPVDDSEFHPSNAMTA